MKRITVVFFAAITVVLMICCVEGCKKTENPIKYPKGTFPDSVINLSGLNSNYDDYNLSLYELTGVVQLVFSSNRGSSGGQFDLVQGALKYVFDQTNGNFTLEDQITDDSFVNKLISTANTPGDDFGPDRFFSTVDGYDYMVVASMNSNGNLDLFYTKNLPYTTEVHDVAGPYPVTLLNSGSNDAYLCFDTNQDSAYFTSDSGGDFDIYVHSKPAETNMDTWFNQTWAPSVKVDSINSTSDDKCPFVYRKIMVFASNRPGGLGGYDLYYSLFKNGKWGSPINFGAPVNTSSDEYRPVVGGDEDFTNLYMMFSSNRPGGKGGFDLYFKGIDYLK
jgi:hypothetical protein